MLHYFHHSTEGITLPEKFTYPFCYTPHVLCRMAVRQVQEYLQTHKDWYEELEKGKMFGVLVVKNKENGIGFVAAYSGILAGSNDHSYFVPPVYDMLHPDGHFKQEEHQISLINKKVDTLRTDSRLCECESRLMRLRAESVQELSAMKERMKKQKLQRDAQRVAWRTKGEEPDKAVEARMIRESQFQKAEYKRLERSWTERLQEVEDEWRGYLEMVEDLKKERKSRSAALQKWLFEQFEMLDYQGEKKNLIEIFCETPQGMPPAGAGECAAPKMLQYAYRQGWKPLAMAEFWWGMSPVDEVRHHGCFYPACKSKCEPILKHMLQGLDVEENPLEKRMCRSYGGQLEVVYEDEYLAVVNKPAGMLSVPGKSVAAPSVYKWVKEHYPTAEGPLLVHRLDMDTSGLLLIAKDKPTHEALQKLFESRQVEKEYLAVLDGMVHKAEGLIELPLSPDYSERPRQLVDTGHGKPAQTRYRVLELQGETTRIAFYPLTGRTHQLRVHAAHICGLYCPIKGDSLYGTPAERLYLHARKLRLVHPMTGCPIEIVKEPDF